MQPQGRKMFRNPNPCKHRVRKSHGEPWWTIPPDKKSERQAVRLGILKERENYV